MLETRIPTFKRGYLRFESLFWAIILGKAIWRLVLCSLRRFSVRWQPALSFERGYCRPNCVACSEVCPTNAIDGITVAEKSAIQIGRAKVDLDICILTTGKECTTCSRNCPASAITCVTTSSGVKAPAVKHETCTGCGACEYFCPTRPQAAIRVKGNHAQLKIQTV